ncbi:MAG: DNA alkylation repair protein [bacterium]|nr:DNA alkylation repair protein [bacterium]
MAVSETAEKPKLWKDYIDRASLVKFGAEITKVHPKFDSPRFVDGLVKAKFDQLELKARIALIASHLKPHFPSDYKKAVDILVTVAPGLNGFENWILNSYVDQFGMDDLPNSVRAMQELTKHGTAEFTIRPFIVKYPEQMLKVIHRWAEDENEHLRRLAAEGTRPRGVWTIHIEAFRKNPRPVIDLLEKLKADDSLYVRKAVANNLNDISKDHPDIVLTTALAWMKTNDVRTNWILKRACRSLIKKGTPEVFKLFGFTSNPQVEITKLRLTPSKAKIGDGARLSFDLLSCAKRSQKLAIDYRVHYVKADGKLSGKVFKLVEKSLKAGESLSLSSKHSFREMTTRKHYPGKHKIEIIVNGQVFGTLAFTLSQ